MRKAVLVGVIALVAAGAIVVITQLGRPVALSVGGALILASVRLMAPALSPSFSRRQRAEGLAQACAGHPTLADSDISDSPPSSGRRTPRTTRSRTSSR